MDDAARTIRVARGVELDLDSTGKALAAELAAAAAAERLGPGAGDPPQPRRRHRPRGHGAAERLAGRGRRRQLRGPGRGRRGRGGTTRRHRHVEHHGPTLATRWPRDAPHRGPADRRPGRDALAHGHGRRGDVRRRQRGDDRRHRPRRARAIGWLEGLGLDARLVATDGSVTSRRVAGVAGRGQGGRPGGCPRRRHGRRAREGSAA